MENSQAKITISIHEGKFEISGSELFVTQQIENFKSIIEKNIFNKEVINIEKTKNISASNHNEIGFVESSEKESSKDSIEDLFPHIFAIDNDKVNIICDIPGSTDSKKALNVALLYSYAQKKRGFADVSVDEIRDICKIHACFDSSNFSSHIKNGNPKLYLDKGSNSNRVITLTIPGEKSALELLKSIKSE